MNEVRSVALTIEPCSEAQVPAESAADCSRRQAPTAWVFLFMLCAICGLAAFAGAAPIVAFGHDVFFFMDNGYRVLQGQVPHRDFASAWGALTYLPDTVGLKISGLKPDGMGYGSAVFGFAIGLWAYLAARRRLSTIAACAFGIYTALLVTAPFPLGFGALHFSHAMSYNRYGFALLGIILVECATAPREGKGGAATGVACALLFFLKVTYAVAAVPIMLVAGGRAGWGKRRYLGLLAGGAVTAAIVLVYLRFDLYAMFHDMAMAASGRSRSWRPGEILLLGFGQIGESVPLMLLAAATGRLRSRWFAVVLTLLAVQGFLLSTNHQPATLPLNGFAAILLADAYFRKREDDGRARAAVVAFLTFACLAPMCFQNGLSLMSAAGERIHSSYPDAVRLASDRGASLVFTPSPFETETGGPDYVRAVNDGLALLRRNTGPDDGVLTIDMMNPFNYLLNRPSPTGGMAAAAYNYVVSDSAHPAGPQWAGSTRYVVVRKYTASIKDYPIENYHIDGIRRMYQPYLDARFEIVEETGHWILYRRR